MDSPEPSKIKGSSSANATTSTPSVEASPVQESPFQNFVRTLSPIKSVKASLVSHGFQGFNSPPAVFSSPRISCPRETLLLERASCSQPPNGETSRCDNGGNSHVEAPGDSDKSSLVLPLPLRERFITDTWKDCETKTDEHMEHSSPLPSVDEYLADPYDQMDTVESSMSDITQPKKIVLENDKKDARDKAEEPPLLSEGYNKFHQVKPANVEEPGKIEGEKEDAECASQECTKLESNLSANVDSLAQDVKESKDCDEMVSTSHVGADNISQDGSEAGIKNHGVLRRCLHFGDDASNGLGTDKSNIKLNLTSSKIKVVKHSGPVTALVPPGSGNFPVTSSKPSGIRLHLNSVVNAMLPGGAATTGRISSDALQGVKSASSFEVETVNGYSISSNMDGQSSVDARNQCHEINASTVVADSFISGSPSMTEPAALCPASVHDMRKPSPTDAEFKQPSPPSKKKKRKSTSSDEKGCKNCKCKKSKCLKLYCECFAAGRYCSGPCICQDCSNKLEFSEKVQEARQQIESRDPLAFVPKVVQNTSDTPSNNTEDVNLVTPSSARHKKGCNCKRSMCEKKYCECFQVGVGCSYGCRCEGCKNAFGRKEDYLAPTKERVDSRIERESDGTSHRSLDMAASNTDRLSPITPLLQCSDQGKVAAKSRLISGNNLSSSESDAKRFPSHANYTQPMHSSFENLETSEMLMSSSNECEMDCSDLIMMDQLPPWDVLRRSESMFGASSVISNTTNQCANIPQSQLSHGCIRQLSGSDVRWRSSPITPSFKSGDTQYMQPLESDSRGLFGIMEDETLDILNESSTSIMTVKSNSPNQKRVSSPRTTYLRGLGSSSSLEGGLKSSRKFILRAVPSFPPLSPCMDGKCNDNGSGNEDSGNSSSNSDNNEVEGL